MADANFNGFIEYDKPDDGVPITAGVEVFASGERNPFGICLHSNGYLYGTDNGPNLGYGEMLTDCDGGFIDDVETEDKSMFGSGAFWCLLFNLYDVGPNLINSCPLFIAVNILRQGEYYGQYVKAIHDYVTTHEMHHSHNLSFSSYDFCSPNPLRASVMNEPRQCKWRNPSDPSDAEYTAPLVIAPSSTGAIIEFESDHFG